MYTLIPSSGIIQNGCLSAARGNLLFLSIAISFGYVPSEPKEFYEGEVGYCLANRFALLGHIDFEAVQHFHMLVGTKLSA